MIDLTKIDAALKNVTGKDVLKAERQTRQQGDITPSIMLSSNFQMILLANALHVPQEEIEELPANQFVQVMASVSSFLFGSESMTVEK